MEESNRELVKGSTYIQLNCFNLIKISALFLFLLSAPIIIEKERLPDFFGKLFRFFTIHCSCDSWFFYYLCCEKVCLLSEISKDTTFQPKPSVPTYNHSITLCKARTYTYTHKHRSTHARAQTRTRTNKTDNCKGTGLQFTVLATCAHDLLSAPPSLPLKQVRT